ncbi:MAG: HAD family hydrolase [Phycisphaerae bacterium]|nr:HAD family hydrolase [Phycisphaerae bacterium]
MIHDCRLVVFDMDGTLTHDAMDFETLRVELGLTERRPILEWIAALGDAERDNATKILEQHEQRAAEMCRLRVGVVEMLEELVRRGMRTALLTRNSRSSVQRIVARHRLSFEVLVSRDEPPFKPHPESLERILRHYRVGPGEALMVGDNIFDLQVAHGAQVASVLLVDGAGPFPPFAGRADFCIGNIADIVNLLDRPARFRNPFHGVADDGHPHNVVEKG